MTVYRHLFDHVLTRSDPEKAQHTAFRAIRAGRPITGLLPKIGGAPGHRGC